METKPLTCTKRRCDISIYNAPFGSYYCYCTACKKSAGLSDSEAGAVNEWNRWSEIGGFIVVDKEGEAE